MPISSLILKARAGRGQQLAERLEALPGVEVPDRTGDDLVVVTDTPSRVEDKALGRRIEALPELLSQTLIYHNFEDVPEDSSWTAV